MAKIEILKAWHIGKDLIHTGIYRIPQDMSAESAALATNLRVGVMLPEETPKPSRTTRKTPAPENKVVAAPEDKETKPFRSAED